MEWKMEDGSLAPKEAVAMAEGAAVEFRVPVGILLGTVECESDFRLDVVSSAGAVGPCQFLPKYAADYYRYAGFSFDLTDWESIRGLAAVFRFYYRLGKKRYSFEGAYGWRYALLSHRYGQASEQAETLQRDGRVEDVEEMMRRNGLWYDLPEDEPEGPLPFEPEGPEKPEAPQPPEKPDDAAAEVVACRAAIYALTKLGARYSQSERDEEGVYDCSSLVARAYAAQGVSWEDVGSGKYPASNQEVYADCFALLWPETYAQIGKVLGGAEVLARARQAGDLQFLCTDKSTSRANRITHVTMVADGEQIVHARSRKYGVRLDPLELYAGKCCALLRYAPQGELRRGMRGLRVRALQESLNARGAALDVDGIYGAATERAVREFGEGE